MLHNPAWGASVLVLGDSLSAAYGMDESKGWVNLLRQEMPDHEIINGSVSGETTAGGLRRLPSLLDSAQPDVLLIELGGNDGLRGFNPAELKSNLTKIITLGQQAGATVLLTEIMVPPNYGPRYSQVFNRVYHQLADEYDLALIPFFMTDIAPHAELMQRDGIHPNERAQKQITHWMQPWISSAIESTD